jgi:REP element-mobilizing transposase RayT
MHGAVRPQHADRPPIRAFHSIFGAYGFWLPNDPRGSWSTYVASYELFRYGRATKTESRRSVAALPHDREAHLAAKQALRFPAVRFTGEQAAAVARGFARIAAKSGYCIHACAILRDHVHLVIARHRYPIEQVVRLLKAEASTELANCGLHPLRDFAATGDSPPTAWARRGWNVYLHTNTDIQRAVAYVERNPPKEGLRSQRWSFVAPTVGGADVLEPKRADATSGAP